MTPASTASDQSSYLQGSPFQLSPGICLSTAYLNARGPSNEPLAHYRIRNTSSKWLRTKDDLCKPWISRWPRCVPSASPRTKDWTDCGQGNGTWDIAFVRLAPSISFTNSRYFEALLAQRLTSAKEFVDDWFELDGISTGRLDLCARTISQYLFKWDAKLEDMNWKIEVGFSSFGASGSVVRDGVCGAPIVDRDGRVAGFIRWVNLWGLYAFTLALGLVCGINGTGPSATERKSLRASGTKREKASSEEAQLSRAIKRKY